MIQDSIDYYKYYWYILSQYTFHTSRVSQADSTMEPARSNL